MMDERLVRLARWLGIELFAAILLTYVMLRPTALPPAEQLRGAASVAGYLLLLAAAAGVAAMATVQFYKVLFLPRSAFHAGRLTSIFGNTRDQVLGLAAPAPGSASPSVSSASNDSRTPAARQPSIAAHHLLDSPTEVVMGQIRSTADYIALRPSGFEDALYRLAGDAGKCAVTTYLAQRKEDVDRALTEGARSISRSNDTLVEVRFFVEQNLNLVHVSLKESWRRRVRAAGVIVAGLVGLLTVALSDLGPMVKVAAVLVAAIWGGFFSWLARDLVALVDRRRV